MMTSWPASPASARLQPASPSASSRLAAALKAAGREGDYTTRGPVVIIAFNGEHMADYFAVAAELRNAGISAEVYLGSSGMKAQMKYADRRMAPRPPS